MIERTVLASRGVGAWTHRIPALAVAPNGRLIAVWDARPDLDDLPAPIDLVMRTSDDGGRSWSSVQTVRRHDDETGFGDASLIVDSLRGRILLFHCASSGGGFFDPVDPIAGTGQQIELGISDDEGETWNFRRITDQVLPEGWDAGFASSGNGIQLRHGKHGGRLLQPIVIRRGAQIAVTVARSDDGGENWATSPIIGEAEPAANESKVVELPDGTVALCSRATPRRLWATSADGGATFGALRPVPHLPDPSDNGGLALWGEMLACSHNRDEDLRANLVVMLSTDDGQTWPQAIEIEPGAASYSALAPLPDGRLGILYEDAGYGRIVFAAVTRTDAAPTAALPARPGGELLLQFVVPAREDDGAEQSTPDSELRVAENVRTETVGRHLGDLGAGKPAGRPRPYLMPGDIVCAHARFTGSGGTLGGDFGDAGPGEQVGERTLWKDLVHVLSADDLESDPIRLSVVLTGADGRRQEACLRLDVSSGVPL